MTTQAEINGGDLAAVNGALSFAMQQVIEVQQYATPLDKRKIDFGALDRALVAAEALAAAHGADTPLPFGGVFRDTTAAAAILHVRGLLAAAAPYRPTGKERRA